MSTLTTTDELINLAFAAKDNLQYEQPLNLDDDHDRNLLVDFDTSRGDFNQGRLLAELSVRGIDSATPSLHGNTPSKYLLFGGHRGCGKSTELRRLAKKLHRAELYYVVLVDALTELDIDNLRYCDILLAQAKVLMEQLARDGIKVDSVFLSKLEKWFQQRINSRFTEQQSTSKLEAGAEAKTGLPFVGSLFTKLTNAISYGSSFREEIRDVVRANYSEFADAFNTFIQHVNERVNDANQGKKLLFIIDGTDRLSNEDAKDFFTGNVHQLTQIHSYFIYCTPIDILVEDGKINQIFKVFRLPMVKIAEKNSTDYFPEPLIKLSEFIEKRVDSRLFVADTITHNDQTYNALYFELIKHSGGHIRDLMRLLDYCLTETAIWQKQIDATIVQAAIKQLATEYRRLILDDKDDIKKLVEIDRANKDYTPASEQSRRLLYDLVLLEYNSYWWQSHPAVRTLPAYQQALSS